MDAYSFIRGMKTLKLRVERQNESALKIAQWLQQHPMIEQVNYPGLESHPNHDVAKRQMRGYGGMLSFAVKGGLDAIKVFLPKLQYAHMAANLGCVETVVGPPVTTSHVECSAAERAAAGIPEGMVRYSTGIEDVEDLLQVARGDADAVVLHRNPRHAALHQAADQDPGRPAGGVVLDGVGDQVLQQAQQLSLVLVSINLLELSVKTL